MKKKCEYCCGNGCQVCTFQEPAPYAIVSPEVKRMLESYSHGNIDPVIVKYFDNGELYYNIPDANGGFDDGGMIHVFDDWYPVANESLYDFFYKRWQQNYESTCEKMD